METFEKTLYNLDSKGNRRMWQIKVEDLGQCSKITNTYGILDKKLITNEKKILKGKNSGRKNQTSHYEQALVEANTKINKKMDEGYSSDIEKTSDNILPMLCLDYFKFEKHLEDTFYLQPKLDGIRAVFHKGSLYTRKGKKLKVVEQLFQEDFRHFKDFSLDGELYSYNVDFQRLTGLLRTEKVSPEDLEEIKENVFYVVYDTIIEGSSFKERFEVLQEKFQSSQLKFLKLVENFETSKKEIDYYYKTLVEEQKYEGLIIRNPSSFYEKNKRSKGLLKYKKFIDSEYNIVDYKSGEGIEDGLIVFVCKTEEGKMFSVRPKGTHQQRKQDFLEGEKFLGKKLTVKYFELTNDGIPRFPVGISVRDYE